MLKPSLPLRILASTAIRQKRTATYGGRITKQLTAEGLSGWKILRVDFWEKAAPGYDTLRDCVDFGAAATSIIIDTASEIRVFNSVYRQEIILFS